MRPDYATAMVFEIADAGRFATCYVAIEMVGLINSMEKSEVFSETGEDSGRRP